MPIRPSALRDDVIVTGEAVALEVRQASIAPRVLAITIDVVLYLAVGFGALMLLVTLPAADESLLAAAGIAVVAMVMVGLPTSVETLSRGRSLGKLATGIAIVRDDGGPVRFRHSLIRALVGVGELWMTFGGVALTCAILHPKGKRVGDVVAGTYCVRVRGGGPPMPPLVMPAGLAAWAAGADIRALPDGLALAARRFLARTRTLNPEVREPLGRSLAAAVEPLVAPPPPWGTPPEQFLAAVLVARRDREYALGWTARRRADAESALLHRLPFGIRENGPWPAPPQVDQRAEHRADKVGA